MTITLDTKQWREGHEIAASFLIKKLKTNTPTETTVPHAYEIYIKTLARTSNKI